MSVIITLYITAMLLIGFFFRKKVQNVDDYFLAGKQLPTWIAVPTIVATWYGAGSCLGVSGTVYSDSIQGVIADPFGCALALVLAGLFFAQKLRKKGLVTVNEVVGIHYGKLLETCSSLLTIPFYIGTLASQLIAMAILLHSFADVQMMPALCISALVVLLYTFTGGMWAVVVTDFVQFFVLTASLIALLFPFIQSPDAFWSCLDTFTSELAELGPKAHPEHGFSSYAGQWLMTGLGALMGQDLIQRFFACRDEKVAKKSTLLAAPIYLFLGLIPILLGIYGRAIFLGLDSGESLLPILAKEQASPLFFTLFVLGLLSMTMSTADSYLLAGSSIVVRNLLPKSKNEVFVARMVAIVLTFFAALLALFTQNIYALMVHSGAFLFVMLFVPVTAALYLPRVYPFSGWVATISGLSCWLTYIFIYRQEFWSNPDPLLYAASIFGAVSSFAGFFASELFCTVFARRSVFIQTK